MQLTMQFLPPDAEREVGGERAAQRTSLAQNNADLHSRLDRAQSRSHEQQETIEHLQVCYNLLSISLSLMHWHLFKQADHGVVADH